MTLHRVKLYGKQNCTLTLKSQSWQKELKHEIYRKLEFLKTEGAQHFPNFWKWQEMTGNNRNTVNIQNKIQNLNFLNMAVLCNMLGVNSYT